MKMVFDMEEFLELPTGTEPPTGETFYECDYCGFTSTERVLCSECGGDHFTEVDERSMFL